MNAHLSAPPVTLDVRVATSAVVGLRYSIDARGTDIDDLVGRLEEAYAAALAQRGDVLERLERYRTHQRGLVDRLAGGASEEYRRRLEEAVVLAAELGRLDEELLCLRERVDGLRDGRASLRSLSASLKGMSSLDGAAIDGAGAAGNQAVRQLFHLIAVDHASTVRDILEGPMQVLADAAFHVELLAGHAGGPGPDGADAEDRRRATDRACRQLARSLFALHPDDLRHAGLVPSLRRLVADQETQTDVRILVMGPSRRLSAGLEIALFRIVQEALGNALAHAAARGVEITLLFQPRRVSTVVMDDGEGFDVVATEARLGRRTGLGLITMRERARIEGGRFDVRSIAGRGTEVRAAFDTAP